MARKVTLVDDITGDEDAQTRVFSVDGEVYEIDLVDSTHAELRKALAGFIESARLVKGKAAKKVAPKVSAKLPAKTDQNTTIREWARKKGMDVSNRGRIAADVVEAFEAAHKSDDNLFSAGV